MSLMDLRMNSGLIEKHGKRNVRIVQSQHVQNAVRFLRDLHGIGACFLANKQQHRFPAVDPSQALLFDKTFLHLGNVAQTE